MRGFDQRFADDCHVMGIGMHHHDAVRHDADVPVPEHEIPAQQVIESGLQEDGASPLEAAIGQETVARYESALAALTAEEREAIVARFEFGLSHQELAEALDKPSADAARMTVARAVVRLARAMEHA